jgi:hypothetical protein
VTLPVSAQFELFFVAVKGSGHRSDMALDDIVVIMDTVCTGELKNVLNI